MAKLIAKVSGVERPDWAIEVTGQAGQEISKILAKNSARALRVWIRGGGCSGMEYVIQLENNPHSTDVIFEGQVLVKNEVRRYTIVMDLKSVIYIKGTEIDWEIVNLSPKLVFRNPNALSSCSCGLSFDPKIQT